MTPEYSSPNEEAAHLRAIETLAAEIGCDISDVKSVYERELARLQAGARLREYLVLLTSRYTMEAIRKTVPEDRAH